MTLPSKPIAARLLLVLLASLAAISLSAQQPLPRTVIFLDPAHGGSDSGARLSDNLPEKTLTLSFATRIRAVLSTSGFSVGDRVVGLIDFWRNGAAAEQASVLPGEITRLPDAVSAVEASTLPIGALTAWQAFFDFARLKAGEAVLIHGGADKGST